MQSAIAIHNFESATNTAEMLRRLQVGLAGTSIAANSIGAVNVTRVFPQPNREFVIQYELVGANGGSNGRRNQVLWGRLFTSTDQAQEYASASPEQVILSDDIPLAIPIFPFDPALPLLRTISNPDNWTESLRNRLTRLDVSQAMPLLKAVDVLAYRLERRAVLRLTLTDSNERGRTVAVIVKVMLPRKAHKFEKRLATLQAAITGSGRSQLLRIPLVYGIDTANGFVFMEYVSGQNLHALVGAGNEFVSACGATGQLLSALHGLPQRDLPRLTAETELHQLYSLSNSIDEVRPDICSRARRAIEKLERGSNVLTESSPACLHTDFYDKQVLWSGGRTTLLDFENLATGDRAKDVGNFLAHLELRALQEPDAAGIDEGREAFLRNYGEKNMTTTNVRWWKETTTLRLAMLYSLRPKWRHVADLLLDSVSATGSGCH